MPSPVGHGLAGLTVHVLTAGNGRELYAWPRALTVVGAALAPDLDLLLRFVDGRNHHQGPVHSLGAALACGLLVWGLSRWIVGHGSWRLGAAAAAGWASHILLDYLGQDTSPPIGLMALWPMTDGYFKFPWAFFPEIGRTLDWATVWNNARAAAWETLLLAPLLAGAWRIRFRAEG